MDDSQFWLWFLEGVRKGFCSDAFCYYHDTPDHTDEEWLEVEEDGETCLPVTRLNQYGLSQAPGTVAEPSNSTNTIHYLPQTEHDQKAPLTGHNREHSPRP